MTSLLVQRYEDITSLVHVRMGTAPRQSGEYRRGKSKRICAFKKEVMNGISTPLEEGWNSGFRTSEDFRTND